MSNDMSNDARRQAADADLDWRAGGLSPAQKRQEIVRLNGVCATWAMTCAEKDEEIARLREIVAGAHALRCTCLPEGAGGADPRCVELWALAGGTPIAEPEPDPLDGFRPDLSR